MSDTAYQTDADSINIHGTALEPAEPVAAEPAEPAEPAEAEAAESPEWSEEERAAYWRAYQEMGYEPQLEPTDDGYVEQAQAQIQQLRQERMEVLEGINQVVQQAQARGDWETVQAGTELFEGLVDQAERAENERQAELDQARFEVEAGVHSGLERIGEWVEEAAGLVGEDAERIDGGRVMDLATDAYGRLWEQFGKETADALVPELIQKTVAHVSDEIEQGTVMSMDAATALIKDLGGKADAAEVTALAAELYQRELYRAGGDVTEALRQALVTAAKQVAGFGERSQPETASVASLHASVNRSLPREPAPQPKLEVKLDKPRDAQGRFAVRPLAETYNRTAQEKAAKRQVTQAQKDALNQWSARLGGSAARS